MVGDPDPDAPESDEQAERRYNIGALAQSYAPRGLADVLNLSPEGRARGRANWRAMPRWQRVALFVFLGMELACGAVLVWGLARESAAIALAGAGGMLATFVGLTVLSVALGIKESSAARQALRHPPDRS
jgi:hypothetical protein